MKRKNIFQAIRSIAAIVIVVVGLTVAPQVQAQDMAKLEQLQKEAEQIEARATARGNFTNAEIQRIQQIQQEMLQAAGMLQTPGGQQLDQAIRNEQQQQQQREREQQQLRQEQQYPGRTRGWPSAAYFRNLNPQLASLRQPAGTNASYDGEGSYIYLTGGNANTVMQDLVRQINTATGKSMTRNNDGRYSLSIPEGRGQRVIWIEQENGIVTFQTFWGE